VALERRSHGVQQHKEVVALGAGAPIDDRQLANEPLSAALHDRQQHPSFKPK
jgi:hypothetical protein